MTEQVRNDASAETTNNHFAAGVADDTGIGTTQDETEPGRTYGQEDVDKIVQRRLKRQENKIRQEMQEQAQEEARRARMDETERLKEEKRVAVENAQARERAADDRVKLAEAKAQAAALGVPQESLKYISRLVDIDDVDVDDIDGIGEAVNQVLKDVPALIKREEEAKEESLTMPMGRDRSPAPSRGQSSNNLSSKDIFNQRLRNRSSER